MKRATKFDHTQRELIAALHALRIVAREVGSNYIAGLQSDVARLEQAAHQAKPDDMTDHKQLSQMTTMLKWLADLDIKPEKGRRRDLKELDHLIGKLNDLVDTW